MYTLIILPLQLIPFFLRKLSLKLDMAQIKIHHGFINTLPLMCTYVPSKAASISSSEGVELFLMRVYIDMTNPGVQNPHCDP